MTKLALSPEEFNSLEKKMIIPVAIAEIVAHQSPLKETAEYEIHLALSEMDPDTALLAIAVSAKILVHQYFAVSPISHAVDMEAGHVINEYAPIWLDYQNIGPMPARVYADLLNTMPEDFEALADLLDAFRADLDDLGEKGNAIDTIADILSIQARAHIEICAFVLDEIKDKVPSAFGCIDQKPAVAIPFHGADNVVLFPFGGRQSS